MSGIYTIPILTSSSDPVAHDFCLCTNNHLLLTAIVEGLSDSGPSSDELIAEMRDVVIADCQDRATELSLTDDTCAEAVDSNYPPVDLDDDCDSCYDGYSIVDENPLMCGPLPMDTGEETGSETGNPLNNLNSHVDCSMGTCEVTDELVQYVLDYPDAYLNNGAIVVPHQPTGPVYGFQFTSVPTGCLAALLRHSFRSR